MADQNTVKKNKSLQRNSTIGEYQVGDCIGKGAFGVVYRGLNIETGEVCAIKQFVLDKTTEDELESLVTEIAILGSLEHPNIVKYVDFVITKTHLNLILEYIEQGNLLNIVKQFGQIPESLIANYVTQTLKGLAYLHSKGVTHCDIKCANILVTKKGELKLTDFGVSRTFSRAESGSLTEEAVGTPYWMAPEVIELRGITYAADIWSLGCVVIELLTGHPPYYDLQSMSALFRIVQDPHPPLPESISDELSDFLMNCFRKDPTERPSADLLLKHMLILKHQRNDLFDLSKRPSSRYEERIEELEKFVGRKSRRISLMGSAIGTGTNSPQPSSLHPKATNHLVKSPSILTEITPEDAENTSTISDTEKTIFTTAELQCGPFYNFKANLPLLEGRGKPTEDDLKRAFDLFAKDEVVTNDDALIICQAFGLLVTVNVSSLETPLSFPSLKNLFDELWDKRISKRELDDAFKVLTGGKPGDYSIKKSYLSKLISSTNSQMFKDHEIREFSALLDSIEGDSISLEGLGLDISSLKLLE